MAKKKASSAHVEKPSENAHESVKPQKQLQQNSMDSDSSEKIELLKSLNQRLVKEASVHKPLLESLRRDKEILEAQLTLSKSEVEVLGSEVAMLTDRVVGLELERDVMSAFISEKYEVLEKSAYALGSKVGELKSVVQEKDVDIGVLTRKLSEVEGLLLEEQDCFNNVSAEKVELVRKLGIQVMECEAMKKRLVETEESKRQVEEEIVQLKASFDSVIEEKEVLRMKIGTVKNEKALVEKSLVDSNELVDRLKEEINRVVGEKAEVEEKKDMEMSLRQELETVVAELNDKVSGLQKEEKRLDTCVVELENRRVEGEEKREEMESEISLLVEENKIVQEMLKELVDEKASIEENLGKLSKELDDERLSLREMVYEKTTLLEEKSTLDAQVSELKNLVDELRGTISKLEEAETVKAANVRNLESELGDYKRKLEMVRADGEEAKQLLKQEKENSSKLMKNVAKLENEIKKKVNAAEVLKAKNTTVHSEKIELESQCKKLKDEITALQSIITDARNESESAESKLKLADANTELLLGMVKDTVAYCYGEGTVPDGDCNELIANKGIENFEELLEKIKKGFKHGEAKVEETKKDMDLLKNSLEGAHKKQSFWTIVSSITTILAAISAAYAMRGH